MGSYYRLWKLCMQWVRVDSWEMYRSANLSFGYLHPYSQNYLHLVLKILIRLIPSWWSSSNNKDGTYCHEWPSRSSSASELNSNNRWSSFFSSHLILASSWHLYYLYLWSIATSMTTARQLQVFQDPGKKPYASLIGAQTYRQVQKLNSISACPFYGTALSW